MYCPFCHHADTRVVDSRLTEDGSQVRRRRACEQCGERFTTFERLQLREMTVVKSGGRKQPFDADKIIRSMQTALRKRPVELPAIEKAAAAIVRQIESQGEAEVSSKQIGEAVMKALIDLDVVGYIRYASVYKDFREPQDFNDFLAEVQSRRVKKTKKAG